MCKADLFHNKIEWLSKMSADMFTTNPAVPQTTSKSQPATPQTSSENHPHHYTSKIPLPSPSPLRRSGSLRCSNEKFTFDANHIGRSQSPRQFTRETTPSFSRLNGGSNQFYPNSVGSNAATKPPPFRRGGSFIERGENRGAVNGVKSTAVANRPHFLNIESRGKGGPKGPQTPQSPANTRIRSLSLSTSNTKLNSPKSPSILTSSPRTPPTSPDGKLLSVPAPDWETESITSVNSGISLASSCDHACVARNGTTFSGRSMKYVVHCNQHAGATGEDYLTPTQRAHKQVKKLKQLLFQAQKDLEQKDSDIIKLTKEVVELRLYKAALSSPEDKSASSDVVTVRENNAHTEATTPTETDFSEGISSLVPNHLMTNSCTDSGHFDDFSNSSVHSKDSLHLSELCHQSPCKRKIETADKATSVDLGPYEFDGEHHRLINEYEIRIQELVKTHEDESHLLKQKHNDKVEELLLRISEINARYWELVPDLDAAKERIKELEQSLDDACRKLEESEDKSKQMYLQMYRQGQQAAKLEQEKHVNELAASSPSRISVPELLHQLQVTQEELDNVKAMYKQLMEAKNKNKIDPEITLQFLKSAIYYFLTDRENTQGHLKAIQSILGFSESEIKVIDQARLS